jgi:hypothetical protein
MNEFDDLLNEMLGTNIAESPKVDDDETWLLKVADDVLAKQAESSTESLAPTDHAIYCLWVIDYAVRNSGTLEPMRELHPMAVDELKAFAQMHGLTQLASWLAASTNEEAFCSSYHDVFPSTCGELRAHVGFS